MSKQKEGKRQKLRCENDCISHLDRTLRHAVVELDRFDIA